MTKKNVLIVSIAGLILSYVLNDPLRFGICFDEYTLSGYTYCKDNLQYIISHFLLFLLLPLLPFSLLALFLEDEVFQSWWNFARWAAPAIAVISFILNGSGGGGFGIPDLGGVIVLVPLYILFISISLVRIWAVSHEEKNGRKVSAFVSIFLTILIAATILFILWQVAASL